MAAFKSVTGCLRRCSEFTLSTHAADGPAHAVPDITVHFGLILLKNSWFSESLITG